MESIRGNASWNKVVVRIMETFFVYLGHSLIVPQKRSKIEWYKEKIYHIFLDDKYHSYINNKTYIKYEPLINFPGNVKTSLSNTTVI